MPSLRWLVLFYQKEVEIDCSEWKSGMYLVRLMYGNLKVGEVNIVIN